MRWKLYYDDESTFDSDDGDWLAAPSWGVMAVAVPDPQVIRQIDRKRPGSGDYYVWVPGAPHPWWVDSGGLEDFLIRVGVMEERDSLESIPVAAKTAVGVKYGRSVDNARWVELWDWIVADADATYG